VSFKAVGGERSSLSAGKAIAAGAARATDPQLATRIEDDPSWRKSYIALVGEMVAAGARTPSGALEMARAGLDALRDNLTFTREGSEIPLTEAFATSYEERFQTASVEGRGERLKQLVVPYRGQQLQGDPLRRQLEEWERLGVMEPSCRVALDLVASRPEWLDLADHRFALLGAGSEMGPLEPLSAWGADVIAVDLPRPAIWQRIAEIARAGSGRLYAPVTHLPDGPSGLPDTAGIDLMVDGPEARSWIDGFDGPITVGNYVYADGAKFVLLGGAVDALVADLTTRRADVALAYLATPTDVFAVPEELARAAREGLGGKPLAPALRALTGGRAFAPAYDSPIEGEGRLWGLADALVPIQGPNYALTKSVQRWRAIAARADGVVSSVNVAPAATTASVVKNKMLAAAYRGAPRYGVEIFAPATARVLTAALLIHNLRNPEAAAHPEVPLDHPYDLFVEGALHGGMWRSPYQPRSVLPLALLRGLVTRR
jgi:hypothetical protein